MNKTLLLKQGGEWTKVTPEKLATFAQEQALDFYQVPCDKARNLSAVLRAFAKAVNYPVLLGHDMDAFFDCICDTVYDAQKGVVICLDHLHSGDPTLKDSCTEILNVLNDAVEKVHQKGKILIYGVVHAGKLAASDPGKLPAKYTDSE